MKAEMNSICPHNDSCKLVILIRDLITVPERFFKAGTIMHYQPDYYKAACLHDPNHIYFHSVVDHVYHDPATIVYRFLSPLEIMAYSAR